MPGVVVTTTARSGPPSAPPQESGQGFFVGLLERGPSDQPVKVRSAADLARKFGDRPSYGTLYDNLEVFFREGGRTAHVARVVGPAATTGELTLSDRAGTPVNTLKVQALGPGSWSDRLSVQVWDGHEPDTFRIVILLDGEAVEDVTNLTSPDQAVAAFGRSSYVKVTNLGSATAAPDNNPAANSEEGAVVSESLTAGTDDRASVTTQHYVDALDLFNKELGDGAVAIPGQTGSTVWDGIIEHCQTNNRIGILASTQGDSKETLMTHTATLDSEYAGLFAPHIKVRDGAGGTRTISPEGFVMACRNRAHAQSGPWRAPAGEMGRSRSIVELNKVFSSTDADELDSAKVNIIRAVANGFRLYGWRSLSADSRNYRHLKDRDVLNRVTVDAERRLERYLFEPIDGRGQLISAITGELTGMLEPIRQAGGLFENYNEEGDFVDPGYEVDAGSEVNTPETLFNDEIRVALYLRVSPLGSLIRLNIVKINSLTSL